MQRLKNIVVLGLAFSMFGCVATKNKTQKSGGTEPMPAKSAQPTPSKKPSGYTSASGAVIDSSVMQDYQRAIALMQRKNENSKQTLAIMTNLTQKEPRFVEAQVNQGILMEMNNDVLGAETSFRKALNDVPNYMPACRNLALLFDRQNKAKRGLSLLKGCLEGSGEPIETLEGETLFALAFLNWRSGRTDEALDLVRRALLKDPNSADAYSLWGNIYLDQGKTKQAINMFERALGKAPPEGIPSLRNNLAVGYWRTGKKADAVAEWKKSIKENRKYAPPFYHLGVIALENGDGQYAEQMFRQLLKLEGKESSHHVHLGIALRENGKFQEAEVAYLRAIRLKAKNPEAYFNLGVLYQKYLKDSGKALFFYQKFASQNPSGAKTAGVRALIKEAEQDFKRQQEKQKAATQNIPTGKSPVKKGGKSK